MRWTADDIPSQEGRLALITGANSGLGLESARALAAKGATVLMACRNRSRAESARNTLLEEGFTGLDLIIWTWPISTASPPPRPRLSSATAIWICCSTTPE